MSSLMSIKDRPERQGSEGPRADREVSVDRNQNSSTRAAWPEAAESRASRVIKGAPSLSARTT